MQLVVSKNSHKIGRSDNTRLRILKGKIKNIHFWGQSIFKFAAYLLLFDLAFIFLFPFIYMVITSLKSAMDIVDVTVKWIPRSLYFDNYLKAINLIDYFPTLLRTVFVTVLATTGHIVSCSMIAYGFARFKFPFKNILFNLVILTIIIPVQVLIISLVILYSKIGWLNTYIPIILPTFLGFGLRGGLFIFIFRQFFMGLPYELEEAARIDGCNTFKTFWTIILPVSKSVLLVSTILSFVWHWNDYFEPSMYIMRAKMQLLPSKLPGLYAILSKAVDKDAAASVILSREGIIMAATFLVILPIMILYLLLQKKFMKSVERSGLVG